MDASREPTIAAPERVDVAVVGAGPSGSMAALVLARAGLDVALIDRAAFPRDKACGDGLMPDALAALRAVGLADRVRALARCHDTLRIYAPNGRAVPVAGAFAVVPRQQLDACLCAAAVEAGARLIAPLRVTAPVEADGRVVGIEGDAKEGGRRVVNARLTVLATGAGAGPLDAFGVCERGQASATAVRLYVTPDPRARFDLDHLCISYDRSICPGYGWIFPGPGGTFNVGVGYFYDAPRLPAITNLRRLLDRFLETFPPARELVRAGGHASDLRGAPLRTGLAGSSLSRPGLIVVGDAAGLTYPISGEGIGKAMESGIIAGETVGDGLRRGRPADAIAAEYGRRIEDTFSARFRAYTSAQRFVARPRLVDFLAWRANRGRYVRQQIEGLVNETSDPRSILSLRGIVRSVFG